jgi:hypothetical protein
MYSFQIMCELLKCVEKNINNFTFCVGSGEAEVVRGGEGGGEGMWGVGYNDFNNLVTLTL